MLYLMALNAFFQHAGPFLNINPFKGFLIKSQRHIRKFRRGLAIGHISPEAASKGPIAALREGDIISVDIRARRLDVELSDEEIVRRLEDARAPERALPGRWLRRYRSLVTSANTGAVLRDPEAVL